MHTAVDDQQAAGHLSVRLLALAGIDLRAQQRIFCKKKKHIYLSSLVQQQLHLEELLTSLENQLDLR